MSANRTPSPWEYKHLGAHHFAIQCIDGQIAKLSVPISANTETVEANAAFIVKACNAHDDLVAALRDIQAVMCNGMLSPIAQGNEALSIVRAALKKAGAL